MAQVPDSANASFSHPCAGLKITDIAFVYRGERRTGEAFVQFAAPDMAAKALSRHREYMGNRYVLAGLPALAASGQRTGQTALGWPAPYYGPCFGAQHSSYPAPEILDSNFTSHGYIFLRLLLCGL